MQYFLKHKKLFIFLTFIIVFGIGFLIALSKSHNYSLTLEYDKSLKIKEVNVDESEIFKVTNISSSKGKTTVDIKALKEGNDDFYVKCLFEENNISEYSAKSATIRINKLNMIFVGSSITELVSSEIIYYSLVIYLGILAVYFFIYFKEQLKTDKFSYRSIFFCAAFLFFFVAFFIYVLALLLALPNYSEINVKAISAVTSNVMVCFVIASIPFVLAFAILLSISNIKLMKMEGKKPINALGIAFSTFMFLGIIIVGTLLVLSRIKYLDNNILLILYSIASSLFVLFESLLFATIICAIYVTKKKPTYDKDFIIILGCKVLKNGKLTPLLKGRADKAIEFYKEQLEKTGKEIKFIPSGGKGLDEPVAEAIAIKKYLLENDISEKLIFEETKSTNTNENMKYSKKIIDKQMKNANIIFSTTNYHVFRSGLIASQLGIKIDGIGSKTKWYFWPNAFIREIAGVFTSQKKSQIFILILLSVIAGLSAYFYTLI